MGKSRKVEAWFDDEEDNGRKPKMVQNKRKEKRLARALKTGDFDSFLEEYDEDDW